MLCEYFKANKIAEFDKMTEFDEIIGHVLDSEGGYVWDEDDPGGETNLGISKKAYPNEDIKGMTRERAIYLYKRDYWDKSKAEMLKPELRYIHFDTAVNMGVFGANKILQRCGKVDDDGIFGAKTFEASKSVTLDMYASERLEHYDKLINRNPKLEKFRRGWYNRVNKIVKLVK